MTLDQLLSIILPLMPDATVGEDNDGQVVIYTNLIEMPDGTLLTMPEPD